jgi:LacI family transcriptional regulator
VSGSKPMVGERTGPRRATLATIAASAGVSVATVSKVLNGRSDVAEATRALVQEVLRRHDYVPPATRRVDVVQPAVELAIDGDLHAYTSELVQGVVDAGAELGVAVMLSRRPEDARTAPRDRAAWPRALAAAGRRALIAVTSELTGADLAGLARAKVPVVVVDPLNLPRARVTSVGSTNFAGGFAATQHLLGLGHRRIGYVGGPVSAACNQARLHGYRAAMEATGVPLRPEWVTSGRFVFDAGVIGGAALLDLPDPPSAIFAGSDEMALGVIEAARARELRVPQDLSLVGFDDTQIARMASPPLTTVRQPLWEMGGVALRTALRLAAGDKIESHHVELATELVTRRSTAAVTEPDGSRSA